MGTRAPPSPPPLAPPLPLPLLLLLLLLFSSSAAAAQQISLETLSDGSGTQAVTVTAPSTFMRVQLPRLPSLPPTFEAARNSSGAPAAPAPGNYIRLSDLDLPPPAPAHSGGRRRRLLAPAALAPAPRPRPPPVRPPSSPPAPLTTLGDLGFGGRRMLLQLMRPHRLLPHAPGTTLGDLGLDGGRRRRRRRREALQIAEAQPLRLPHAPATRLGDLGLDSGGRRKLFQHAQQARLERRSAAAAGLRISDLEWLTDTPPKPPLPPPPPPPPQPALPRTPPSVEGPPWG